MLWIVDGGWWIVEGGTRRIAGVGDGLEEEGKCFADGATCSMLSRDAPTMNTVVKNWILLMVAVVCLGGCSLRRGEHPTVTAEKKQLTAEGWEFVEVVGEAHGKVEAREIRTSDSGTGELTVYSTISGIDGHGSRRSDITKTFKEAGYTFLEVKIGTSPADGYSILFRKKA
jgi:hypothetical protein